MDNKILVNKIIHLAQQIKEGGDILAQDADVFANMDLKTLNEIDAVLSKTHENLEATIEECGL